MPICSATSALPRVSLGVPEPAAWGLKCDVCSTRVRRAAGSRLKISAATRLRPNVAATSGKSIETLSG